MPTTKSAFWARVRRVLKDEDSTSYTWSDDELGDYLLAALSDYSVHFPYEQTATIATVVGQVDYDLPTDFLKLLRVEHPEGAVLKRRRFKPGTVRVGNTLGVLYGYWTGMGYPLTYEVFGGKLRLAYAPGSGEGIHIWYGASHPVPEDSDDDFTIPDQDIELLELYVTAKAMSRDSGADARLSRWREEGKRDDNPVLPEHERLMRRYASKIEERKVGKVGSRWRR